MDDDTPRPPSPKSLSKTPSWILLGFVLGALFVWLLPRDEPAPRAAKPAAVKIQSPAPREKKDLSEIEAVFAEWGGGAVWENDLTEVALWSIERSAFTRNYEVLRSGGNFYYRPIDRLTRPVLTHGVQADSPLQFTETEALRQQWLREKAEENWKAITGSLKTPPPTPADGRRP